MNANEFPSDDTPGDENSEDQTHETKNDLSTDGDQTGEPHGQSTVNNSEPLSEIKLPPQPSMFSAEHLQQLRLPQEYDPTDGIKRTHTSIPVGKPDRQSFVRVRKGQEWRFSTRCFHDKHTREVFLVSPGVANNFPDKITQTCLLLAIEKHSGAPFLWPIVIPDPERPNRWHVSAIEAARTAEHQWVRVYSDQDSQQYMTYPAKGELGEPQWPDGFTMERYLELAFRDRMIDSEDHPVLKRLRGEV